MLLTLFVKYRKLKEMTEHTRITNPHYLGVLTLHCQMQCCLLVAILDI